MLASMKLYSYIFFFVIFLSECGAKNYCASNICNNSKQHTLCKFQSQDPARHCVDYENTIKSFKEKQAILDKLNSRRNKVAAGDIRSLPSAENMMKLEWNEELELSAQRWANQCVKHNTPDIKDTCRDLGPVHAEQNIATIFGESPGLTPLALVDVWYMELLNVNASVIPKFRRSKDAGFPHYEYFTQLVWAKSRQVGCGGVKFKERLHSSGNEKTRVVYRLVCNFAPGGNIVNHTVYNDGIPCSNCPTGTVCDSVYTSLCRGPEVSHTRNTKPERIDPVSQSSSKLVKLSTNSRARDTRASDVVTTSKDDDDFLPPFDFFPHTREIDRPTLTTTTKTTTKCKDVLAVDDFVELLKEKLSTDPMFKDLLLTSTKSKDYEENGFTHALALISTLYTKKPVFSTTTIPDQEYLNSTLLVDLVEAVIFRNGEKSRTEEAVRIGTPNFEVNPIRIQPELGEVRSNPDMTGNLFFPEELVVDDVDENSETTEQYYDVTSFPQADLKIQNSRKTKATKDFVDEILESETATEKREDCNKLVIKKREINNIERTRNRLQSDYVFDDKQNVFNNIGLKVPENYKKIMAHHNCKASVISGGSYVVRYLDLIKKLASDLKMLKLNENHHCSGNSSAKPSHYMTLIPFVVIIKSIIYVIK